MPVIVRALVRLYFGLLGICWFFGGIFGIAAAGHDHAWWVVVNAAFTLVVGVGVAYAAFVRAPWEREAKTVDRAADTSLQR
jgi:predicted RND superfamily exporter protein